MEVPADPEYLTSDDFAAKVRTSINTVRYWRRIGYGPKGARIGRSVLYRSSEVEAFLNEQFGQGGDRHATHGPAA